MAKKIPVESTPILPLIFTSITAFVALQWTTIDRHSFWFDESYTSAITRFSVPELTTLTAADVHPPLYYVLLKAWTAVFGRSDMAMRSLSALLMLIGIGLLYVLTRKLVHARAASFAVAAASIGPFVIRYSQEARMYALASVFILAATLILVTALSRNNSRDWKLWALYSLCIAGGLYTHYFSGLIVLVHGVYVLLHTPGKARRDTSVFHWVKQQLSAHRSWFFALIAAVVAYIPWIPTLAAQTKAVNGGFWIPDVNETSFLDTIGQLVAFQPIDRGSSALVRIIALVGICMLVGLSVYALKRRVLSAATLWLTCGSVVIVSVVLFIISVLPQTTSYYYLRYFAQYATLFYGGIGLLVYATVASATSTRKRAVAGLSILLLTVALLSGVSRVMRGVDKQDNQTNRAFSAVNVLHAPGDSIVTSKFSDYYDALHYNRTATEPTLLTPEEDYGSLDPIFAVDNSTADIQDISPQSGVVWYIYSPHNKVPVDHAWELQSDYSFGPSTHVSVYHVR